MLILSLWPGMRAGQRSRRVNKGHGAKLEKVCKGKHGFLVDFNVCFWGCPENGVAAQQSNVGKHHPKG